MPDANQNLPIGAEPQSPPVQTAPTTPPPTIPPITDGEPSVPKPKLTEFVMIDFSAGKNQLKLSLTMTTTDGKSYTEGPLTISTHTGKTARDFVYDYLAAKGWDVGKSGDTGLKITGYGGTAIKDIKVDVEVTSGLTEGPAISVTPGVERKR